MLLIRGSKMFRECGLLVVLMLLSYTIASASTLKTAQKSYCIVADSSKILTPPSPESETAPVATDIPDAENYTMSNDFVRHESHGWFPKPYSSWSYGLSSTINLKEWNLADNIRSASFQKSPTAFSSGSSPLNSDEAQIKRRFSMENANDDFASTGWRSDGIYVSGNIPFLHLIARLELSYDQSAAFLYADDGARLFRDFDGQSKSFKEVSVLFSEQHAVSGTFNFMLPIYGAYLESEAASLSSVYYISLGARYAHTLFEETTQYVQIADNKNQLRFANGFDTLSLLNKASLPTLNQNRKYVDCALGWKVGFLGGFCFNSEAYAEIPLTAVLSDAEWRQYRFGFRFSIGYEK